MDFLAKALDVALAAAKEAGRIQMKYYEKGLEAGSKKGNVRDIVTNADMEADAAIRGIISETFPEHTIITEENTAKKGNEFTWHVDPIDGTTNYARKGKYFCVSIALAKGDEVLVGVVFNALNNELYTAIKWKGALLNGKKIEIGKTVAIDRAVICTDLCHESEKRKPIFEILAGFTGARSIRIQGSGALTVCEVANGLADCYFNICGSSWDFAAAALIIREAGGVAKSPEGNEWTPQTGKGIIATNQKLYKEILARVKA